MLCERSILSTVQFRCIGDLQKNRNITIMVCFLKGSRSDISLVPPYIIPRAEEPWFFQCRPASPAAERGNGIILRSRVLQKVSTPRKEASPSEPIPVCRLRREFIVVE